MWVKGEYFDQFEAAAVAARGLLDQEAQPDLHDRLDWYRETWAHFSPGISPLIVRAVSEKTQAWLFFARQEDGSLTSLTSIHTLAFRPVYSGAPDDMVKVRLLTAIAKRMRYPAMKISRIIIDPVPVEDGSAAMIAKAFGRAGWGVAQSPLPPPLPAHDIADDESDQIAVPRAREQIKLFNLRHIPGLFGYAKERLSALVRRAPVD